MSDQIILGEEDLTNSTGTMPPNIPVDPNGLQTMSTGSGAAGLALLTGGGAADAMARLLGLGEHAPQVLTAGFSLAGLGRVNLLTAGLILVALSVVLNVASLVIRWQNASEIRRQLLGWCRKVLASRTPPAPLPRVESTGTPPPNTRVDPIGK